MTCHDLRGFYAIVDPEACRGRDPVQVGAAIVEGGCAALQLRAKSLPDAEHLRLARALRQRCTEAGVAFFVNDRCDIASLAAADGVHLGQDDLPLQEARKLFPSGCLGRSTHDAQQAHDAVRQGADLVAFGPVFPTRSKHRPDPVVGIRGLRQICAATRAPVIAIGGITQDNVHEVVEAGASLACAIAAVCGASEPARAAATLHTAFRG